MKKNNELLLIKLAILLNTIATTGYLAYNEWQKQLPQDKQVIQHICQITGADQSKSVIILNCIEEKN